MSLFALLLAACGAADGTPCSPGFVATDDGCEFDEDEMLALAGHFDDGSMERVNAEPFDQVMGEALERNVWVAGPMSSLGLDAATLYRGLDPSQGVSPLPAEMPVGTVLVHEAVNGEQGHGIMAKIATYEEAGEDSWFAAKVWPDGMLDLSDCNPCESCHVRESTERLWGVPPDARR